MAKNKADKLYTMQLTKEEVLMLQRIIKDERKTVLTEYDWEAKLRDSLETKAGELYQKPHMSQWDHDKDVERERTKWPDAELGRYLANAESIRLHFYYQIDEARLC